MIPSAALAYAKTTFRLVESANASGGDFHYVFPICHSDKMVRCYRKYSPTSSKTEWMDQSRNFPYYPAHLLSPGENCLIVEDEAAVWNARYNGVDAFCIYDDGHKEAIAELLANFERIQVIQPNNENGLIESGLIASASNSTKLQYRSWSEHDKEDVSVHTVLQVALLTGQSPYEIIESMPLVPASSVCAFGVRPKKASHAASKPKKPSKSAQKEREPFMPQKEEGLPVTVRQQVGWFIERFRDFEMFYTPTKDAFIRVDFGESRSPQYQFFLITADPDSEFGDFLEIMAQANNFFLDMDARQGVCRQLGAMARTIGRAVDSPPVRTYSVRDNRGETVYIDMFNKQGHIIQIDGTGWKITDEQPVFFRRGIGMLPMVVPQRVPDNEREKWWNYFKEILNLGDESNWVFAISFLLNTLRRPAGGAYAFCSIHGPEDSGKTIRTQMFRHLVDPHESPVARMTHIEKDRRHLAAMLDNNHVLAFGNLSSMSSSLSDDFCEVATGTVIPMRKMRSNKGLDHVKAFSPMIFNGIADFMHRPDLKRRTVFIRLPEFQKGTQRNSLELMDDFHRHEPIFLGLLLDALSCGIRHYNDLEISTMDQLGVGDFAHFMEAAGREPSGLPWYRNGVGYFRQLYEESMKEEASKTSDNSVLMQAVVDMFHGEVKGQRRRLSLSPNDMYLLIRKYAMISSIGSERMGRAVRSFSARTTLTADVFWKENNLIESSDVSKNISSVSHFEVFEKLPDGIKNELERTYDPPLDRHGFPSNVRKASWEAKRIQPPLRRVGIGLDIPGNGKHWSIFDLS